MKLWSRILKGLKNNDLERLASMIMDEQVRRAEKRISEGKYETLNEQEQNDVMFDYSLAFENYVSRTGCPRVMANMVFNNYLNNNFKDLESLSA